jgi:hypothetical protein
MGGLWTRPNKNELFGKSFVEIHNLPVGSYHMSRCQTAQPLTTSHSSVDGRNQSTAGGRSGCLRTN